MQVMRILLALVPLSFLFVGCAEMQAGVGLDPDITVDYVTIQDPTERKAAIERDLNSALDGVKANPKSFEAQMQLGKMRRENGDNKGAIESYSKAIEVDGGNIRGYKQRAMTYFSTQEFDKAAQDLDEALKLAPSDLQIIDQHAYAHMKLALQCRQSSDFASALKSIDAAISDYQLQLKRFPNSGVASSRIGGANLAAGETAAKSGDSKESRRRYLLAVESFQNCVNGNFVGNGPPAGNRFFQAQARAGLAKAYLELEQPQEALKAATAMPIEELPKDALIPLYMVQMRAYEKLSDQAKATEIEKKLESLGAFHRKPEPPKFPAELNNQAQERRKK